MNPEQKELEDYANSLAGSKAWKYLVRSQYTRSRKEGLSHKEAMDTVYKEIIRVSTEVLDGYKTQAGA